ncbi:MAG: PoNe immunity protein domain-containing protein [Granulosicoccus sp.]
MNCSVMRDPHKPRDYFLHRIEIEKVSIADCEARLERGDSRRPDAVIGGITDSHITTAKCLFCLGEPIGSLYEPVYDAITVASKHEFANILGSWYATVLEMTSLAILLDLDQSWFEKLATVVDREPKKDRLMENLLSYRLDDRTVDVATSLFLPSEKYLNALTLRHTDKQQAAQQVHSYLEDGWLDSLRWLTADEKIPHESKVGYFGYWDYVSAAITKLCDLDDSSYRDSPYYPADLMPR